MVFSLIRASGSVLGLPKAIIVSLASGRIFMVPVLVGVGVILWGLAFSGQPAVGDGTSVLGWHPRSGIMNYWVWRFINHSATKKPRSNGVGRLLTAWRGAGRLRLGAKDSLFVRSDRTVWGKQGHPATRPVGRETVTLCPTSPPWCVLRSDCFGNALRIPRTGFVQGGICWGMTGRSRRPGARRSVRVLVCVLTPVVRES